MGRLNGNETCLKCCFWHFSPISSSLTALGFVMAAQTAPDLPHHPTVSRRRAWGHCRLCGPSSLPPTILILGCCRAIEIPYDQCYGLFNSCCYLHKHGQLCFLMVPWRPVTASLIFPTRSACNLLLTSWLCWVHFHMSSFYPHSDALPPLYCYFPSLETISLYIIFTELRPCITLRRLTLACPRSCPWGAMAVGRASGWQMVNELGARPGNRHGPACRCGHHESQDRWSQGRELEVGNRIGKVTGAG